MTITSFVDRAQRGYDWLASDEAKRLGFDINLLNPDLLNLEDACGCALGETYQMGNYWDAMERLADEGYPVVTIDDDMAVDGEQCSTYLWERMHGFLLGGAEPISRSAYAELTDAWRHVIKKERDR